MNKAFYIIGIVFGFIFMCTSSYYIAEVGTARSLEIYSSINSYSDPYSSYTPMYSGYDGLAEDATSTAATVSLFFFLIFIAVDLLGILKVKTKTNRIFGIIGLSLSGIMFLWNFLVMADPGAISFDEVGPIYVLYSIIVIAFSIVGLIQTIRFLKQDSPKSMSKSDILDS